MSDQQQFLHLFLDLLPNQPKTDQTREKFRQILQEGFDKKLPEAVERIWQLPPVILKDPFGEYMQLLLETRALFVAGHFYSCVAMCGIVGERLVKDVLRASVMVEKDGSVQRPKDVAFDQFERAEINAIVRFLKEADLLSLDAARVANDLCQLRNTYAHARGKDPERDASKAIRWLHTLVEDTVSIFKHYEIKDGSFVRKTTLAKEVPGGLSTD